MARLQSLVDNSMIILLMPLTFTVYGRSLLLSSDAYYKEKCLLGYKFYHRQSGQCYPGLERGPCGDTEMMVPDTRDPGLGRCQRVPAEARACHTPAILDTGEITCLEDTDVTEVFTQAHCNTGELLMPANFILNKKPCPDNFHCSLNYKKVIQSQRGTLLYEDALEFLKTLKCDDAPRSVCLPDNGKSPFLSENIYQSFKNSKLVCMKNPCPHTKPIFDEEGYYVCQNNLVPLWTGSLSRRRCRRGQILRRGICVSRFFG